MEQILDNQEVSGKQLEYCGFWIRVGAAFIDGILLTVVNSVITFSLIGTMFIGGDPQAIINNMGMFFLAYALIIVINIGYYVGMESSSKQATLGKMALGMIVINEQGEKLSFANALGRHFSKIISAIILYVGFMMVGWDKKNQGLHDKIAGTYVIKK